jgi:hypothetical protein
VDLILWNKKNSADLILEYLVLPKTAVLMLQYEASRCHARGTSFLNAVSVTSRELN